MLADPGSITDVDGIAVGHHQRTGRGWRTGTTMVLAPHGAIAGVDVRGGGPGTRETDALAPWNLVDQINAICLTGGSAYGLRAADGAMSYLAARDLGYRVGPEPGQVVPVVPTAVIFDLGRGGSFANHPDASFGERACRAATHHQHRRGSIGAGTGAMAGGVRGGVGMASCTVALTATDATPATTVTVGAICVVNARGSLIDLASGKPHVSVHGLRRPTPADRTALVDYIARRSLPSLNTTIGVVATDAAITRPEATRLAMSGHDGLARAINPVHTLADGDTLFALSTRRIDIGDVDRVARLSQIQSAAATCVAHACVDAILAATPAVNAESYGSLCPSALR
jgi:L-aminopeptidase/D-esterase-like protein